MFELDNEKGPSVTGANENKSHVNSTYSAGASQEISNLERALAWAAGYRVFPCNPVSKKPYTPHGFKDATTDEATIRGWWQKWPNAPSAFQQARSTASPWLISTSRAARTALRPWQSSGLNSRRQPSILRPRVGRITSTSGRTARKLPEPRILMASISRPIAALSSRGPI